jgi:coenzyme Q-binding protein COQ10
VPKFSVQKTLPYTAEQLFNLVADIKSYPQFVPGILNTQTERLKADLLKSTVEFGNRFYKDHYICQVALIPLEKIKIQGLKGPFTYMDSEWKFIPQHKGFETVLNFTVNFEFRNTLLKCFAEPLFTKLTNNMVQAFENRAKIIYSST